MRSTERRGSASCVLLKREAGENPARTRHCIERADTGRCGGIPLGDREGCVSAETSESGDLPVICTETAVPSQATSNWLYAEK